MRRRDFLLGTLAAATLGPGLWRAGGARGIGPAQKVRILRVRYEGRWDPYPTAMPALADEIRLRTSIDMDPDCPAVALDSEGMRGSMFAVLAGDGAFELSAAEHRGLARWLGLGGFLVFDNVGASAASKAFDDSARRALGKALPRAPLKRVSPDHVIYRSFYRVDFPAGRAIHRPYIEGLSVGERIAAVLNPNDLSGALARSGAGRYQHVPTPGGESQRETAYRFGVNLMLYATCLHYKDDQVHLDYLLHKRKWKIQPPE